VRFHRRCFFIILPIKSFNDDLFMGYTLLLNPERRRLITCLFALLFLLCQHAGAQTSRVVEIPFNFSIKAIEKDKNGLMWIGTSAGIRTYDSYQYQTIGNELDTVPVTCLVTDTARKLIWAGTDKGVYAIDYITQTIKKKYISKSAIQSLLKSDKKGTIFAVEESGVLWMIVPEGKTTKLNVPQLANPYHAAHSHKIIVEDGDDLIFFTPGLDYAVWHISLKNNNKIIRRPLPYLKNPFSLETYKNLLILGSWGGGIKLVDKNTFADKTFPILDSLNSRYGRINTPQCFLSGDMLYVFFSGAPVWRIDLRTGKGDEFWNTNYSVINRNKENAFYVDRYQTLWIGQTTGMISIQNDNNWFEKILSQYPGLVFKPSVRQIIEDDNHDLFVGSYSGLFHFSARQNSWELFDTLRRGDERARSFQEGLLNDSKNGYVYIAADHFYRFDKKKGGFENNFYQLENFGSDDDELRALCLIRDSNGKIWIGGEKGLAFYEEKNHKLILQKKNNFDIGGYRINYFYQPADKNLIWMGTENGLYQMDINTGIRNKINNKTRPALSNDVVYCITEDHKGNMWVATDAGINIIAPSGKHIRYITARNSNLCNSVVYGLLWENDNELWISTQNGLCNYSLLDGSFTNYFENDGLCNNEFNRNSLLKDHNGKMYFGGIGGVTAFYPEKISKLPPSNQIFVSAVSIWDSYTNTDVLYKADKADGSEIVMDYNEKALTISMGLSDYTAPDKTPFSTAYRDCIMMNGYRSAISTN
jgi:ligand-binding sensor domain-containing protein